MSLILSTSKGPFLVLPERLVLGRMQSTVNFLPSLHLEVPGLLIKRGFIRRLVLQIPSCQSVNVVDIQLLSSIRTHACMHISHATGQLSTPGARSYMQIQHSGICHVNAKIWLTAYMAEDCRRILLQQLPSASLHWSYMSQVQTSDSEVLKQHTSVNSESLAMQTGTQR